MNVQGVLMLNWPTVDRRPSWDGTMLARAVSEFRSGSVPLTDGHPDADGTAVQVGELRRLYRSGEGLRLEADLEDDAMLDRLDVERRLPISAEYPTRTPWLPASAWRTVERSEGQADDYPLVAVAILRPGEQAARAGSWLWSLDDQPSAAILSRDWNSRDGTLTRSYHGVKVTAYEEPALLTRSGGRVTRVR